ncbi:MAG: hypothetical protein ORO03_10285, partial [Alphaproteobacteria bacterium]|nr:hypothetical protein [Alphaproteobacteria bacterium]
MANSYPNTTISTNIQLDIDPIFSSQDNEELYEDIRRLRRSVYLLQLALDNYTGAVIYGIAGQAISYGQVVAISVPSADVPTIIPATASVTTRLAIGIALDSVASSANMRVQTKGVFMFYSATLSIGSTYYLSNTAGQLSTTP